jgi:hypothetical protein
MKKNILFTALLAAFALVSCSDEDHVPVPTYSNCQICDIVDQPELNSFDYEVCVATVGDVTTAYVAGGNTQMTPEDYFSHYCQNAYDSTGTPTDPGTGGTGTPTTDCVTCPAYTVGGVTTPAIPVCKGTNGHAFLDNVDTNMDFDTYLDAYHAATGGTCQ